MEEFVRGLMAELSRDDMLEMHPSKFYAEAKANGFDGEDAEEAYDMFLYNVQQFTGKVF